MFTVLTRFRHYLAPAIILLVSIIAMRISTPYASLLISLFAGSVIADTNPTLNVTTIVGRNGVSALECWSLPAVISGGVRLSIIAVKIIETH